MQHIVRAVWAIWANAAHHRSFIVQAVYGLLKEAEHRSTFYIPYWNLPLTKFLGGCPLLCLLCLLLCLPVVPRL